MNIANPYDYDRSDVLHAFHFGAYGCTHVFVWGAADSIDDALEEACDWLADNAPGIFLELDYSETAEELGLAKEWADCAEFGDYDDSVANQVIEATECDMYVIGHTTYPGLKSPAIASWEWSVCEASSDDTRRARRLSRAEVNAA